MMDLLKGYWTFDGTDISTVFDSSPNSNHGGMFGDPQRLADSLFNRGLYCDGQNDYFQFGSLHNDKFTEYTVQSWVRLTNYSSSFSSGP